ncbi:MAG: monovalent cation/H(+) antiporter subunit G [Paracoccaceae bacterium]|nr:monovalent cation/H(+) antiporter subunit G [Paracoccaceae bacterium]
MEAALDILSWAALVLGGIFYLIGAVGLNRMPDLFTRMHAVSVSDTLGVGLLILGMGLQAGASLITVKLVIIVLVLWTTGAVASHALARAALHDGEKPVLIDNAGNLVETDCVEIFPELAVRLAAPLTSEVVEEAPSEVPLGSEESLEEPGEPDREANRDARPPAENGGET